MRPRPGLLGGDREWGRVNKEGETQHKNTMYLCSCADESRCCWLLGAFSLELFIDFYFLYCFHFVLFFVSDHFSYINK